MQGELVFTLPPRTHAGDAATSHEAEARSRKTWNGKHRTLLAMLDDAPGLTALELADRLPPREPWPIDRHARLCEVRRRLSDLAHADPRQIRRGPTVKGQREARWFVV